MERKSRSRKAKNTLVETAKEVTDKVVKGTKQAIEIGVNSISNDTIDNVKKDIEELKAATKTASKTASKKVKEVSDITIDTVSKTSEKIVSAVKNSVKKEPFKSELFIQSLGKEISEKALLEKFEETWEKGHKISEIKDIKIYYKVEENIAYFVVNDNTTILISLF